MWNVFWFILSTSFILNTFRDQSPHSPSWQYFCYNPLFKSNLGGPNCPEGIRLNSGTPRAPIPRPIWLWVKSDMAPIYLLFFELPLFLSACFNFHPSSQLHLFLSTTHNTIYIIFYWGVNFIVMKHQVKHCYPEMWTSLNFFI